MPFGVSKDFLDVVRDQQRRALLGLGRLTALALAGGVVAELLDPPRVGSFVVAYIAALVVGLIAGGALGRWETRDWAASLEDGWQEWMHSAIGAKTVGETAERAGATNLDGGPWIGALLAGLNVACLIAAWFALPAFDLLDPYGAFAIVTVSATGAVVGAYATKGLVEAWWCREVEAQTIDLVESGRVGVWGYG